MRKFKKMYVEITNVCNLNCKFCPKTKRNAKFMTADEFRIIAKKLKGFGKFIYLHVLGEPLLHPQLKEILDIAQEYGFKVNITTNGTLLKEKGEILLNSESFHRINISLHSFEANDEKIDLKEYIKNITDFAKKAVDKEKICLLRLWNIDGEFTKADNALNDDILKILEKEFQLEYTIDNSILHKGKNLTIKKFLYVEQAEKFEWPDISKDDENVECFCYGLRDQIGVLSDGSVIPCCLDHEGDIVFGNLFEKSLDEILNTKRAVDFYDGFTARRAVEKLCKTCGYATRFSK
mgnify:FL=1